MKRKLFFTFILGLFFVLFSPRVLADSAVEPLIDSEYLSIFSLSVRKELFFSFFSTILLEFLLSIVYFILIKVSLTALVSVVFVNVLSLSFYWIVHDFLYWLSGSFKYILICEFFIFLFEGLFLFILNRKTLKLKKAFFLSLLINSFSFFIGNLIWYGLRV